MGEFDWRNVQDHGNVIADALNRIADAISESSKPRTVGTQEPTSEARIGRAITMLAMRGAEKIELRRDGIGWCARVEAQGGNEMLERSSPQELPAALEYVVRRWLGGEAK